MHRFFATIRNEEVILSEMDAFHLLGVLHIKSGEHIEIVFEERLFECVVESTLPLRIRVIHEIHDKHHLSIDITLFMCLTKGDKPDTVIERATEIGVKEIVIVNSDRSIVRLDEDQLIKKLERFSRIAKSAASQSKRMNIPQITYLPFKSIFKYQQFSHFLIGEANDKALSMNNSFPQFKKGDSVAIIIGPEGGFSSAELQLSKENNVVPICFSSNVLRAEVASIAALSIINYLGNLL